MPNPQKIGNAKSFRDVPKLWMLWTRTTVISMMLFNKGRSWFCAWAELIISELSADEDEEETVKVKKVGKGKAKRPAR